MTDFTGLPLWLEKLERLERLERLGNSIFFAVKCLDWLENHSFLWSEKSLKGTPYFYYLLLLAGLFSVYHITYSCPFHRTSRIFQSFAGGAAFWYLYAPNCNKTCNIFYIKRFLDLVTRAVLVLDHFDVSSFHLKSVYSCFSIHDNVSSH